MVVKIIEQLEQPEYTGENRCVPCTVLNLAIAFIAGITIARKSKALSAVVFGVSIGLIYLRGYLVPGTPTLTKQYLPPEVLRWFGKKPEKPPVMTGLGDVEDAQNTTTAVTSGDPRPAGESEVTSIDYNQEKTDIEIYYEQLNVLKECENQDDLCLTEAFGNEWTERIESLESDEISSNQAVSMFGLEETNEEYIIEKHNDARVLLKDDNIIGQWPSEAALIADVSAASILSEWDGNWEQRRPQQKGELLSALRLFLEECPSDRGDVELIEDVVESCCYSRKVLAVVCSESGERLAEHPLNQIPE
ncbi:hypothetical protein EA462_12385 [Natrarchaeobius halalkaliphilus]|uniref:Uncharacterized protein n=1 Tax=Natrarchaeobius halalkaliphilus TaxID=1679091 RepID=A0A3N6NX16_9EURY|nr:hypothetical protein [Natrarchaeobius halalkaliphilus]RQG89159.1 hypothetical protein EA462_12385 [Natrarchaeobius halalkaliphilus]